MYLQLVVADPSLKELKTVHKGQGTLGPKGAQYFSVLELRKVMLSFIH